MSMRKGLRTVARWVMGEGFLGQFLLAKNRPTGRREKQGTGRKTMMGDNEDDPEVSVQEW